MYFTSNYFLDDKEWKRKFYRFVDSYQGEDMMKLREIESDIFQGIKAEIAKDYGGQWTGCELQNRMADEKIASCIKASFRSYEKQGLRPHGHFFKF